MIIGDNNIRGKRIGEKVMRELVRYACNKLQAKVVELNVFDRNAGAIRCYKKVGLTSLTIKQARIK